MKELVSLIGNFIQYWGFKKIHGQIWAYIFLAKEPLDSTTLVKRLGVSKALVSLAVKDLLHYEVIQVVGKGRRRKILFESNPNIYKVILNVLREREKTMLEHILAAQAALLKKPHAEIERLDFDCNKVEALGTMVQAADCALEQLLGVSNSFFPTASIEDIFCVK